MNALTCPFCDFADSDAYFLTQHVELCHPENGESPFIAREHHVADSEVPHHNQTHHDISRDDVDEDYVDCPHKCGESFLAADLQSHMDMHVAESLAIEDAAGGSSEEADGSLEDEEDYSHIEGSFTTDLPRALRNRQRSRYSKQQDKPLQSSRGQKKNSIMGKFLGVADYKDYKPSPKEEENDKPPERPSQRLGRKELGPHAYEKKMPRWLQILLEDSSRPTLTNVIGPDGTLMRMESLVNETPDVIPVLAQLCKQDPSVQQVFFCHPATRHICKIDKEGGFCGYRNVQMLISYIRSTQAEGFEHFLDGSPSIFKLQDLIEAAWDQGFNSHGRVETGGIKGTRKYIGTPEAQALFDSLDIECEAAVFGHTEDAKAVYNLLDGMEKYFQSGSVFDEPKKVHQTFLPPIYFQHQGHSLTIIGLEIKNSGAINLLVFDPIFKVSPAITRLLGSKFISQYPGRLLKAYRRGDGYLKKYSNFEILKLKSPYESADEDNVAEGS